MVENDHKELAIILQGSVMMDEVQVVERKIGVVKSRSSVLNQDMISSAELARALVVTWVKVSQQTLL